MKKKIAEQIGADCEETWLKGQTKDNALNAYIAAGEYPDFISGESKLYDAGALIPIDEYWDNYPNIKNYLTEEQWDLFLAGRRTYLLDSTIRSFTGTGHGSNPQRRSFLIQDKSFEMGRLSGNHDGGMNILILLERYSGKQIPCLENGTPNIPFAILCDDWRYFLSGECSSISGWISE